MLVAYHADPALKAAALAAIAAGRDAGSLVQGDAYWKNGKGSAVGCLLRSGEPIEYEQLLGIPVALALLEDAIFGALPRADALLWPERFLGAVEPGADLSGLAWRFLHWLLTDEAVNPGIADPLVRDAAATCAALVAVAAAGHPIDEGTAERAFGDAIDAARAAVAAIEACEPLSRGWDRAFIAKEAAWCAFAAAESLLHAERPESSARAVADAAGCAMRGARHASPFGQGGHAAAARMADTLTELVRTANRPR